MKNIFLVFIQDLKRISTNVVAIVVLIGLTVIPSLYAWFNTLSNWDPYGTDSTSRIKVAVASDDPGVTIDGVTVNIGDQIISNLKANTTIGWVFTDSTQEAIDGVYSGDYYAALVLPSDFTSDMVSFLSDSLEHPQIQYYCNQKKNAIAPKITDKAKKAVQSQTNSTFVNTLTKSLVSASSAATGSSFRGGSSSCSGGSGRGGSAHTPHTNQAVGTAAARPSAGSASPGIVHTGLPGSIAAAVHSSCAAKSSHKRVVQRCFIVHRLLFSTF